MSLLCSKLFTTLRTGGYSIGQKQTRVEEIQAPVSSPHCAVGDFSQALDPASSSKEENSTKFFKRRSSSLASTATIPAASEKSLFARTSSNKRSSLPNIEVNNNRIATSTKGDLEVHKRKIEELVIMESVEDDIRAGSGSGEKASTTLRKIESINRKREERRRRLQEEKENRAIQARGEYGENQILYDMIQSLKATLRENQSLSFRESEGSICVAVRKRPLSMRELAKRVVDIVTADVVSVVVHEPKVKFDLSKSIENHRFRFDLAFDEDCDNLLVYRYTTLPLIKAMFNGSMATCFAYGQTGSGKTYTMGGQADIKGLYSLAAGDIFKMVRRAGELMEVRLSFFEIYGSKVLDLLNEKAQLKILEDNRQKVVVVGLTEIEVADEDEMLELIQKGNASRTSSQTKGNESSSRSHAVLQVSLFDGTSLFGRLSLVDLAGNEKGSDTISADRQTQIEGAEINKSLLALKECIRALGKQGAHLPFRASKLTQVLKDSFVGDRSKTCMIAMISPGQNFCENTLNTLRYADRVKELKIHDPADRPRSNSNSISDTNTGGSSSRSSYIKPNAPSPLATPKKLQLLAGC
ncbi:kinesin-like protein Klp10A [Galendromus occidentalis]|uniref:Kinesin-like protein n=1 Tax=Galendromus occidentalis TaxID=34638 RepID=A0AAJ6QSH6_9ACAR|nr:kinesin-like protein Klp10A [Galendromus occidentalis]